MKKRCLMGIASLLLTACSAPKPPKIVGVKENVNILIPSIISDQTLLLRTIQEQLLMNHQAIDALNKDKQLPAQTFVINYPFNGTQASKPKIKPSLVAAKSACKLVLRARTDGVFPSEGDKAVARRRAVNLRERFIEYGISPRLIFINYAAATDYADNNWTIAGREKNRRVEIDIFNDCSERGS